MNILASSIVGIAFGWKLGLVIGFGGLSFIIAAVNIRIRPDQHLEERTGALCKQRWPDYGSCHLNMDRQFADSRESDSR